MSSSTQPGHVLTLYSFKGGVGRTMAVANIAYLAAHNGARVLVMDWDLEAPGLVYYFRGLLEPAYLQELKQARGVLDLVWEWQHRVLASRNEQDLEHLVDEFRSGAPFQDCVRAISESKAAPTNIVLDFIGAGSALVATPEPVPYEEALARFSWSSFFEDEGGGIVVESLRDWAKKNYDLILIDSRTGLADVAGLCTMQLPDEVALCFVLNRQNIDGTARVAAAIRDKRSEAIRLRAMPMRVARVNTPEESDARARALADLTRVGGFAMDDAEKDMTQLAIAAAENVPFYETLAPFAAPDYRLDLLTLNYRKMASALLGRELAEPVLPDHLLTLVHRRLQPRQATVEYVNKELLSAEPNRAIDELTRLIESAHEMEVEGHPPESDYIRALVEAAYTVGGADFLSESYELQGLAIDLLKSRFARDPSAWKGDLAVAIERHIVALRQISFGDDEGEWVLLEELDSLLADSPAVATRLRRITYRRRAAWLAYGSGSGKLNEVGQLINEVLTQAVALRREPTLVLSPEQEEDLTHSELDMAWLRAELFLSKDDRPTALQEFRSALDRLVSVDPIGTRSELRRLRAEFNARLATLVEDRNTAARHAVEAAVWSTGNTVVAFRFDRLALVVLASDQDALVLQFCEIAFGVGSDRAGRHLIANFYGRQGRRAVEFLDVATLLVTRLTGMRRGADVFSQIASTALQVVRSLVRRIQTVGEKTSSRVVATVHELVSALRGASISDDLLAELTAMAAALESTSNVSTRRRVLRAD